MPDSKKLKALDIKNDDTVVELIGLIDNSPNAEMKSERVQELVTKIILLGQKRGRPSTKEESDEIAA